MEGGVELTLSKASRKTCVLFKWKVINFGSNM